MLTRCNCGNLGEITVVINLFCNSRLKKGSASPKSKSICNSCIGGLRGQALLISERLYSTRLVFDKMRE